VTETLPLLILVLHVAATLYMTGLIWFVQRVHYPLFAAVGPGHFARYEEAHVARTTLVVAPPMLLELATGIALLLWPPPHVPGWAAAFGLGLIAVIWTSTWIWQVPRHRDLAAGFDAGAHARLVSSNRVRTVAWSLRAPLVLWMTLRASAGAGV
jgi:hypothetical protein